MRLSSDRQAESIMRLSPYTGPTGTQDLSSLSPDEFSEVLETYRLFGEAFEESSSENLECMLSKLDDPLALLHQKFTGYQRGR